MKKNGYVKYGRDSIAVVRTGEIIKLDTIKKAEVRVLTLQEVTGNESEKVNVFLNIERTDSTPTIIRLNLKPLVKDTHDFHEYIREAQEITNDIIECKKASI
ncbi:hypothetical protein [Breznakia pachnodae]|uniref:Uncharacterized protein n=1 Tax=Breznakia pachnodae TaxID=265178 RepID=A0ABU0E3K9_9FIRM|nr:hypothetical protein [Breznakia pachnodae]MDQ0361395.1 hypothetical protein [Breznakia pachnodae]